MYYKRSWITPKLFIANFMKHWVITLILELYSVSELTSAINKLFTCCV